MILRPAILRGGTTPEDRARFQDLVHTCGLDSLAPYVLQDDKASHHVVATSSATMPRT